MASAPTGRQTSASPVAIFLSCRRRSAYTETNNNPKSAEREKSNMRDDSRVVEQRQLQTGKVGADRILNPFKQNGTKNQKAAKDEQPISRPELSACLCP